MSIGEWVVRLLPGLIGALFFILAADWLQTRSLNAQRKLRETDDRISLELPAPIARVYLAAEQACSDLGWQLYGADDQHYTLWAINRTPHLGLRNMGVMVQLAAFGSGETGVTVALNSPHPAWVRARFRRAANRFLERLRLRVLGEPGVTGD